MLAIDLYEAVDRKFVKLSAVASLAWVPWVPGNPSIFEQLIPEQISFGKKVQTYTTFSVQDKQELVDNNLK